MTNETRREIVMDGPALEAFLAGHYPQAAALDLSIEHVDEWSIRVRMPLSDRDLRPGGTVSGPSMMTLADVAMYLMTLAQIGPVELAVTTNLNINFLRKPASGDLIAMGQLLKLGRRLAVGEVGIYTDGDTRPVAHTTLTYSIPPETSR